MYVGLAISMVSGATWPRPMWAGVIAGLVVISIGIVMKRLAGAPPLEGHAAAAAAGASSGTLADGAGQVVEGIEAMLAKVSEIQLDEVKSRVEKLIAAGPDRIGAAQEALAARVGFATYAEVMAPLATAERLLYRAWSAAADGHRVEVERSLQAALPHAREAAALAREKLPA
jgi:hypothetical protein